MGISLVTKAEYKAYAGLTSANEDKRIDILIPKVSEMVKSLCRRSFVDYVNDVKEEYFEGGYPMLMPSETPLIAVTSLEYSADYGATYTALVEFTDFAVLKRNGVVQSLSPLGFPETPNGYKLTYTAGYETLPEDLKLAIFDLISYYIRNDSAIHSNKAPGTNTVQIEYVTTTALPAHIKRVFDLYTTDYS